MSINEIKLPIIINEVAGEAYLTVRETSEEGSTFAEFSLAADKKISAGVVKAAQVGLTPRRAFN